MAATFVTFDIPTSGETLPESIHKFNEIVGVFTPTGGHPTGFLREPNGDVFFIAIPGSVETVPTSINDSGEIVGNWNDGSRGHCFVQKASGRLISCDPPNTKGAIGNSINNVGHVAGEAIDIDTSRFLGTFGPPKSVATFSVANGEVFTFAITINDSDVVAGHWGDSNSVDHGFVRTPDGSITPFDAIPEGGTTVTGIDAGGAIIGSFVDDAGTEHSFVRDSGGAITIFDVPGVSLGSRAVAINDKGTIAGFWKDNTLGFAHGYVRK